VALQPLPHRTRDRQKRPRRPNVPTMAHPTKALPKHVKQLHERRAHRSVAAYSPLSTTGDNSHGLSTATTTEGATPTAPKKTSRGQPELTPTVDSSKSPELWGDQAPSQFRKLQNKQARKFLPHVVAQPC
jgi:hypothetical protein